MRQLRFYSVYTRLPRQFYKGLIDINGLFSLRCLGLLFKLALNIPLIKLFETDGAIIGNSNWLYDCGRIEYRRYYKDTYSINRKWSLEG